jgi:hypothetical protein
MAITVVIRVAVVITVAVPILVIMTAAIAVVIVVRIALSASRSGGEGVKTDYGGEEQKKRGYDFIHGGLPKRYGKYSLEMMLPL